MAYVCPLVGLSNYCNCSLYYAELFIGMYEHIYYHQVNWMFFKFPFEIDSLRSTWHTLIHSTISFEMDVGDIDIFILFRSK